MMSARSIGLLACSSLLLAPLLCSCSDDDSAASSDDAGSPDDDTTGADDDATDDDDTSNADDDTADDDTADDDTADDDATGADDDSTNDDDTSNGADAGLLDAGGDDVPLGDAGVWDGGVVPELDGGELVAPDSGLQSDGGLAACTPLTQPAPTADGGVCFPACIAELQAACSPEGACGSNSEGFEITSCWSNGVELTTSLSFGATNMSDNVMFSGDDLCYASSYSFDEGSYEWTNSCGEVVAIGVEDQTNPSLVTITCLETGEDTLVDLENPACNSFSDGVPSVVECSEDPSCGQ